MSSQSLSTVAAREEYNGELRWKFAKTFIEPVLKKACNDDSAQFLLPSHEFQIRDPAPAKAVVKSRKIAFSWGEAATCYCRAATEPNSTSIIGSYDEEEAKEKLNFIKWIDKAVLEKYPSLARDLKMNEGSEMREMRNGSRIRFIPRKAPVGPGAAIHLDEFSVERPGSTPAAEVLIGALGCTTYKGSVSIGGTQRGPDTMFNQIISGKLAEKMKEDPLFKGFDMPTWKIREFPWWSCPALCKDPLRAILEAPGMDTYDRVTKFGNDNLKNQYILYLSTPDLGGVEIFKREFECFVLSDDLSYYEYELIRSCYDLGEDMGAYWFKSIAINGAKYGKVFGAADVFAQAKLQINALAALCKTTSFRGDYALTMDVGRTRDHDEIWIGQTPVDDREMLIPRLNLGMEDMPFDGKEEIINYAMAKLPMIRRGLIDGTSGSMGVQLAERMHKKYKSRLETFEFTNKSRNELATGLKARMENQKMVLPRKTNTFTKLEAQLLRVKKIETKAGNIVFDVARTRDGHGDSFWSLAMMSHVASRPRGWQAQTGYATKRTR